VNNRKTFIFVVALIGFTSLIYSQNAADFEVKGKVLTRYNGTVTDVVIPANLGITEIGKDAFARAKITSVVIPAGVTTIGERAFLWCESLTAITVDKTNPAYTSVDGVLFNKAKTTLVQYPIGKQEKSYKIPSGVKQIGNSAFSGCKNLIAITIPAGVTAIGESAFYTCENLTSVTIPIGVTSIGDYAFSFCYSLAEITIPESVTEAGDGAFARCNALPPETRVEIEKRFGEDVFVLGL